MKFLSTVALFLMLLVLLSVMPLVYFWFPQVTSIIGHIASRIRGAA